YAFFTCIRFLFDLEHVPVFVAYNGKWEWEGKELLFMESKGSIMVVSKYVTLSQITDILCTKFDVDRDSRGLKLEVYYRIGFPIIEIECDEDLSLFISESSKTKLLLCVTVVLKADVAEGVGQDEINPDIKEESPHGLKENEINPDIKEESPHGLKENEINPDIKEESSPHGRKGQNGLTLLCQAIDKGLIDVAYELINDYPSMAAHIPLEVIIKKPELFYSGTHYNLCQRFLYHHVPIENNSLVSTHTVDVENQKTPKKDKSVTNDLRTVPNKVREPTMEAAKGLGIEWMKKTADSYTITAALIITIVFAAAITVPGGNNSDTGKPIYETKASLIIFAISDAISLLSSIHSWGKPWFYVRLLHLHGLPKLLRS
ncbi:ankyrin repeat family protein, partial [Tanacetum coccineum]